MGITNEHNKGRRLFSRRVVQIAMAGVVGSAASRAEAIGEFTMSSSTEGHCITCRFWGGIRKVSRDGSTVGAESLGWCNNPKSKYYQKTTTPQTGPMDTWRKWEVLG